MGEPVKITSLAKKMTVIRLTERSIQNLRDRNFYGCLRPGEKLYEELLIGDNVEGQATPDHDGKRNNAELARNSQSPQSSRQGLP